MRLAYANAFHDVDSSTGGNAHIGQFVVNCVALGHDIWVWPGSQHPLARVIPKSKLTRLKALRQMDAIYVRIEWNAPGPAHWSLPPFRTLLKSPFIVWEFNAVPEFGLLVGASTSDIDSAIETLRRFGTGCDLAICVSESLTNYVTEKLGIRNVVTVPNHWRV